MGTKPPNVTRTEWVVTRLLWPALWLVGRVALFIAARERENRMAEHKKVKQGARYKVGDQIPGPEGPILIPDNELGRLIIAAKEYANAVDLVVGTAILVEDGKLTAIQRIEFVQLESIPEEFR